MEALKEISQAEEKVLVACLTCEGKGWEIVQGDHYMPMQETCSECGGKKVMCYDRAFIQACEPDLLVSYQQPSDEPVPWIEQRGAIVLTGKAAQLVAEGLTQTKMSKEKQDFMHKCVEQVRKNHSIL